MCAFGAKKVLFQAVVFILSPYDKSSKNFFIFFSFTLYPCALLIEIRMKSIHNLAYFKKDGQRQHLHLK
jgi:hypothetical protein